MDSFAPIGETSRLILRRYREDDLQDLLEYLSDPETVAFEPYEPMDIEAARENLAWRISTDEMTAVELKASGRMIGNVYLGKRDFQSLELGFVFNRAYTGFLRSATRRTKTPGGFWRLWDFAGRGTSGRMCILRQTGRAILFGRIRISTEN